MNKIEELERKIKALSGELETFKATREVEKDEWPKEGEGFYYFRSGGGVEYGVVYTDKVDADLKSMGNCFRSKEEAEKAVARIKATERIRKIIKEERGGWRPDWDDFGQEKYYLGYRYYAPNGIYSTHTYCVQSFADEFYYPVNARVKVEARADPEDVKLMLGVK